MLSHGKRLENYIEFKTDNGEIHVTLFSNKISTSTLRPLLKAPRNCLLSKTSVANT